MQLMLMLMLVPFMVETCGAWVSVGSPLKVAPRLELRSTDRRSRRRFNACHSDPPRCRRLLLRAVDGEGSPLDGAAGGAPSAGSVAIPGENGNVEGGAEGGDESNSSSNSSSSSSSVVRAALKKPVGLVLAEKAIGQPGLVVDDMVDGGSAQESGIVARGMTLVSACGVDCGPLLFDQVVEMLQNSPPEEPIDFVFSSTMEPAPP